MKHIKKFFFNNSLSIVLLTLFLIFLMGLSIAGWLEQNQQLATHGQPAQDYIQYVMSGEFGEAVFENWESEFMAVGILLVLSIFLLERGSPESKPVGERREKTGSGA